MLNIITSNENKQYKRALSLKTKKARDKDKLFIVEGRRFVDEIPNGYGVDSCFMSESFYQKYSGSANNYINTYNSYLLSDKLFAGLSGSVTPQGVAMLCKQNAYNLDDISISCDNNLFVVMADNLRDPGNLGTLIRTCGAAGVDFVILSENSCELYNPKTVSAMAGTVFRVKVITAVDLPLAVHYLKDKGVMVAGSSPDGARTIYETDFRQHCALIVGNESNGISEETKELCDCTVKIPMPGTAESLNASVAGGVLIYEVVRQRTK